MSHDIYVGINDMYLFTRMEYDLATFGDRLCNIDVLHASFSMGLSK